MGVESDSGDDCDEVGSVDSEVDWVEGRGGGD